jgi:hypothetical protein
VPCRRTRLRELRLEGGGPDFVHLGRAPLYRTDRVLAWEATLTRRNTSGP